MESGEIFQGCFISTFTLVRCVNFKKCHGKCRFLFFPPSPIVKILPLSGNRFGYLNRMEKKLESIPERTRKSWIRWWNMAGALILTRLVMHSWGTFFERKRVQVMRIRRRTKNFYRIHQSIPIFLTNDRRFRRKKLVSFIQKFR